MKNEIHQTVPQSQNREARNTKGYTLTDKDYPDASSSLSPQKLEGQPSLTSTQIYHVEHWEDNTLFCKELGQTLPSTPQGDLDLEQFVNEIAARKYFYPPRQYRQQN